MSQKDTAEKTNAERFSSNQFYLRTDPKRYFQYGASRNAAASLNWGHARIKALSHKYVGSRPRSAGSLRRK